MMCEKNIDKKIMEKKTDRAAKQRIWKKGFLAVLFSAGILTGCQMEKAANPKVSRGICRKKHSFRGRAFAGNISGDCG